MGEIGVEKLKEISEKLKGKSKTWATILASEISKTKEWKSRTNDPCSPNNVRNMFGGLIKGKEQKRLFAKCAAKLLLSLTQQEEEATTIIREVFQEN